LIITKLIADILLNKRRNFKSTFILSQLQYRKRSEFVRRKGTHSSRNTGVKKGGRRRRWSTQRQFRVCCKDRYYSSTSEHLFSHDKWQNGIRGGRIEKERKQTLEEKSCLLITLSPVLINPSTGERNPNWKSNFNQDICVFCILFSRAERAKVRVCW